MSQLDYKQAVLKGAKRVVIKVGSAVLSDVSGLDAAVIVRLAAEVDEAVRGGREVILVTSGAIAAGRARLAKLSGPTIGARQAAAATGQIELMRSWAAAFSECDRTVAQILLTHEDVSDRKRRQNAMQTMTTLLASGVIPIINENDTVAVEEIRFGDNDMLSSLVASMVQAQMLVILSDVAGVLTGDPRKRPDAHLIPLITNPEAEMKGLVAESAGPLGTGGMACEAEGRATGGARGHRGDYQPQVANLARLPRRWIHRAKIGTLITPAGTRLKSRKHWIAFALKPSGALGVDKGAAEALRNKGRSLLPSGIREVRGEFAGGDCVSLIDPDGIEFGRGLVNYAAPDVAKLKGRRTAEISSLLGYKVADEIIHRDNFVLLEELG